MPTPWSELLHPSKLVRRVLTYGDTRFSLDFSSQIPAHHWWINQFETGWEDGVFAFLNEAIRAGDSFLDIGASIGPYTVFAAMKVGQHGRVVAIEPDPIALQFLRHNLELNGCGHVRVVPGALNCCDQPAGIKRGAHWGDTSTRLAFPNEVPDHIVPGFSLRTIYKNFDFIPTFIKIDIEGGERLLLDSASLSLALAAKALIVEMHKRALGDDALRLSKHLEAECKAHSELRELDRRADDNYHLLAYRTQENGGSNKQLVY